MSWLKLILTLACLLCTSAASAEFYKYLDEQGNVHFTDDYNQVPPDQRKQVKGYEEVQPLDTATAAQVKIDPAAAPVPEEPSAGETAGEAAPNDFDRQLKSLDQRKAELAAEYETLMQENTHLNDIKKSVKNRTDADQYNESVRKLNTKLQEHDRQRKEFFSDVEAYNARVGQENLARKKSKPAVQ
ncbi:MAG: DUF4124 domain-containing protein [Desulfobacterales bacterium]